MAVSRREFVKQVGLYGGAGLLCLAGGTYFLLREGATENSAGRSIIDEAAPANDDPWSPRYARLAEEGLLDERLARAQAILEDCTLCPRQCRVNRLAGEKGFCRAPARAMVYSHQPHLGEEQPLVGQRGSGTIFFSNCNLRCVFCQNWPIAHEGWGEEVSDEELAEMMLHLQNLGCHNINLVTPTHVMPAILGAVQIAFKKGLNLPLCYNTSGYERREMLDLLDGIVDIYLPDYKFMDGENSRRFNLAEAGDYHLAAGEAIRTMYEQVGNLVTDDRGIALSGLMIRHLVMPNGLAGTPEFVRFVAEELSPETYVNIMSQYRVEHRAFEYPEIARAITPEEYVEAMEAALAAGLTNLDRRSLSQLDLYRRMVAG